jgi:hypothetical protein
VQLRNLFVSTERHAEEKATAAQAAAAVGDAVAAARAGAAMGGAADAAQGVSAEPPSERALRLTWRAWRGALPKMLCVMV